MGNWEFLRANKRKLTEEQKQRIKNRKKVVYTRGTLEEDIEKLKFETKDRFEDEIERNRNFTVASREGN